jgi:hypothetical protein
MERNRSIMMAVCSQAVPMRLDSAGPILDLLYRMKFQNSKRHWSHWVNLKWERARPGGEDIGYL